MDKNLLSIGSVVELEGATKKLMIIGTTLQDDTGKVYDYIGVPYPEGFIDDETMFLFMHEDIQRVHFIGYVNAEMQAYRMGVTGEETEEKAEE